MNREARSEGGIIGFTLRKGALLKWLITRHVTGEYAQSMKAMCSSDSNASQHEDLSPARQARDINDVKKIVDALTEQYQDLFDLDTVPANLVNIVTGEVATQQVQAALVFAYENAKSKMTTFVEKRLVEFTKTASFWDTQARMKILNFSNMIMPLPTDSKKKLMIESEVLFRRLFCIAKMRNINLRTVLTYELAAVPPSLFFDDGSMRKTAKADLAQELESVSPEVHHIPPDPEQTETSYIIDGFAILHSLNETTFKTYDDLADILLQKILRIFKNAAMGASEITVVFDRYQEKSINQSERQRRGASERSVSYQILGARTVPNYRNYLKVPGNKSALANFISDYLEINTPAKLQEGKSLILSGGYNDGKLVKVITATGVTDMPSLYSTHEEADTRMVLHAINAAGHKDRVIIRSDDTDVLVILLYYFSESHLS